MKEVDFISQNQESYYDVYVNEAEMSFWKVVMQGPAGSPYGHGTFVLSVSLTDTFPQTPPLIRFLTPVLHPNVTKHGRICHAIFTNKWKTSYHVHTVLQYIHELLNDPEASITPQEILCEC
ncbi:ubiquitin-conjugating enzyme/RWD-like protein [Tricladium varicosporioides]|nr:ubiquitin-conjugating enzyme/RWD-like protein [Hymenoscyphus varicosporioides]